MLIPTENDWFLENAISRALILPSLVGHAALYPVSRRAVRIILQEFRIERRQSFVGVEALFGSDRPHLVALHDQ